MPNIKNINNCNGCGACYSICPTNAISMKSDIDGFLTPVISQKDCISCGKCDAVCTAQNQKHIYGFTPKIYAVKAIPGIIEKSSSGGIFGILASYILSIGGRVCGAIMDENFHVKHVISGDANVVEKMKKSKYVQSEIGDAYQGIKVLLNSDVDVLFAGTPCQVNGLLNYLDKTYDNLYTFDIFCHGVPSPKVWEKYILETQNGKGLKNVDFRPKIGFPFGSQKIEYSYEDTTIVSPCSVDLYMASFMQNLTLRKSCYNCKWAEGTRVGDFSGGDFWGASKYEQYKSMIDNDRGLSVLFVNSYHAECFMHKIAHLFSAMKEIPYEHAVTGQRKTFYRPAQGRTNFFNTLDRMPVEDCIKKNLSYQFDIALYGNTLSSNYGAALTYLALFNKIQSYGYRVAMIAPPLSEQGQLMLPRKESTIKFFEKYSAFTNPLPLNFYAGYYKNFAPTFMMGSDQVWRYGLFRQFGLSFYLDFVDSSKRKLAYGVSFGDDSISINENERGILPVMQSLISSFDAVSSREKSGAELCYNAFGVHADAVLDPVFFVNAENYNAIAVKPQNAPEGAYVVSYMIGTHEGNISVNQHIARERGIGSILIGDGEYDKQKDDNRFLHNVGIDEWLWYMSNADYIVTSSFHGLCFAIIFKKEFAIVNATSAASRYNNLLSILHLEDRMFVDYEDFISKRDSLRTIDYEKVYEILNEEISKSSAWLEKALIG